MSDLYRTKGWKRSIRARACLLLLGVYLFAGQLLVADAVPQGKIGIIGSIGKINALFITRQRTIQG